MIQPVRVTKLPNAESRPWSSRILRGRLRKWRTPRTPFIVAVGIGALYRTYDERGNQFAGGGVTYAVGSSGQRQ